MSVLDRVLGLRPTNAATRLGERSRLPLLDPRDLLRALLRYPTTLLTVPVTTSAMFAPLLRAAREQDAVIGFSIPHRPMQRDRVERLVDGLVAAADEVGHQRPVFLQAGPLRLGEGAGPAVDRGEAEVFRSIDAGASLVSLDLSEVPLDAVVHVGQRLAEPVVERELSLELSLSPSLDDDELRTLLGRLAAVEVRPLFLRVRSDRLIFDAVGDDEPVLNFDRIEALKRICGDHGAQLSIEDRGTPPRLLPSWTAAGVRKVELTRTFAHVALPFCPEVGLSLEGDVPLSEATAQACSALDALAGRERDRLEARVFSEALECLAAFGAEKSSVRAMRFLYEHPGE